MTHMCNPAATPRDAAGQPDPIDQRLDVDLFRALGEPTRARLFACLLKCARPCSITEIAECCDIDYSVVSRHVAHLSRAGLIDTNKQARTVWCTPRAAELVVRLRSLADAVERWQAEPGCCGDEDGCG